MRTLRLLSALLVVAALSVPAGALAGPVVTIRIAFGEWEGKHFDRNHWEWLGAFVLEETSVGEAPRVFGGVFRGTCERKKHEDGVSISCEGSGGGRGTKLESFSMDPAASSAVLDVTDPRFRHHVEWTATQEPPFPFESESGCPAGEGHGGGFIRPAIADGKIYGRHYRSEPSFRFWNELWVGAEATQCGLFSAREISDLRDGGTFTLRQTSISPSRTPLLAI
jgi:hypothetical protein